MHIHDIDRPVFCLSSDKLAHWTYTDNCKHRQTDRNCNQRVHMTIMPLLLQLQQFPHVQFCPIMICNN